MLETRPSVEPTPAGLLISRLESVDPTHHLADSEYRQHLLLAADPYMAALTIGEINRLVGGNSEGENGPHPREVFLHSMDGGDGEPVVGFVGIHPADRADVFEYALHQAQSVAAKGQVSRAGLILSGTVVALQMFPDANKRTARVMYYLADKGYDGSAESKAAIVGLLPSAVDYRPSENLVPYPNSQKNRMCVVSEWLNYDQSAVSLLQKTLMVPAWVNEKTLASSLRTAISFDNEPLRSRLIQVLQQPVFGPYHLLVRNPDLAAVESDKQIDVLADEIKTLTPEDAAMIIQNDRIIKKDFVKRLIDATTGEAPLRAINPDGTILNETEPWANIGHWKLTHEEFQTTGWIGHRPQSVTARQNENSLK